MSIEQLLICPSCKAENSLVHAPRFQEYTCKSCKATYPIKKGNIIDFFPEYQGATGRSQKAMEMRWVSKIYESIWRPIFNFFGSRIRYKDEVNWLADAQAPTKPNVVVDLACGTGKYARMLSEQFQPEHLIYIDLSLPMLQEAQQKAKMAGIENAIFIRASVEQLPLKSDSVDWMNCFGALHLFPDTGKALKEMQRTMRSGAHLTCMTARRPDAARLPLLPRMVLGNSDFKFFYETELIGWLEDANLQRTRTKKDKMIMMFEAQKV